MNQQAAMLEIALESALRWSLFVAIAACITCCVPINKVSLRVICWRAVLIAGFVMPVLVFSLEWRMPLPQIVSPPITPLEINAHFGARELVWKTVVAWVYIAGVAILLLRQALGLVMFSHLLRRAQPVSSNAFEALNISSTAELKAPSAFGSTVLLPYDFRQWSELKLRAVLVHEKTHVANRDFYFQQWALLHRALFWFNPLAWWLPNKLAMLAEYLSDDAVLHEAVEPTGYAAMLLEFAAHAHSQTIPSVAMARIATVSARVQRILDIELGKRALLSARSSIAACYAAMLLLSALAFLIAASSFQRTPLQPRAGQIVTSQKVVSPRSNPAFALGAQYPSDARSRGLQGTVVLRLHVPISGYVDEAIIEKSSGIQELDEAAKQATLQWLLSPGTVDGVPTAMWGQFAVTFRLSND